MTTNIDFYALNLSEIETTLNIKPIQSFNLDQPSQTFDTWEEVAEKLSYLRQLERDPSQSISIYGYELVNDNHYIKLYYSKHYSNA